MLVMEVSRPDFMGLGLVSVSTRKGPWSHLGLEVQRSRSCSITTLSRPQDLKEEKNEKRGMKKALGWQ